MHFQDTPVRFTLCARAPGTPSPLSIDTQLTNLSETILAAVGELTLVVQYGAGGATRVIATWRDMSVGDSKFPGVVYDYPTDSMRVASSSKFDLPRITPYMMRDDWLAAVCEIAQRFLDRRNADGTER